MQIVPSGQPLPSCRVRFDVRRTVFGHLTSKKVTFFRKFNIANHDPIEAKFYTEMHMGTPIPHVNFYKDQINLTYVSMATNVPL